MAPEPTPLTVQAARDGKAAELTSLVPGGGSRARGDHLGEEAVQGPQHLAQGGMRGGLRPLQFSKSSRESPFPDLRVPTAPANFQNTFSLPRGGAPGAAHRGPVPRGPEAGDELRARGRGEPPKYRQRPHLRLRVLVLRAGPWHSQVCTSRPSHCCQRLCPAPVCTAQTFLDFMYLFVEVG